MHGCGSQPKEGARHLKEMGFQTVVGGRETAAAAMELGMEAYLCSGAYRGPAFEGKQWLAEDMWGRKQEWFSSTCPTREEVRAYNLECIRQMAETPGIKGILIDGARFASPNTGGTEDAFYTCFCPHCMKKAEEMGFDAKEMRMAAAMLYDFLHGKKMDLLPFYAGLREWMEFRRAATTEHLLDFVHTIKKVNPDLKAGIYIFPPALSDLVGQHYRDLRREMDLIAPMLYRCYPDETGPACLNTELAVLLKMLEGAAALTAQQRIYVLNALTGHELVGYEEVSVMQKGLEPAVLKRETQRARMMAADREIIPIIELDDPKLEQAAEQVAAGGADGINFFLYDEELVEKQRNLWKRLAE